MDDREKPSFGTLIAEVFRPFGLALLVILLPVLILWIINSVWLWMVNRP
ncbi:MAG: hypothetical protein ACM3U2_17370 [Deltaproteobacteria bacterium]